MTTLAWPAALPEAKEANWSLRPNTQTHTSPLDRSVQTLELAGAQWMLDLTFAPFTAAQERAWLVFVTRLRGAAGRVYVPAPYPVRTIQGAGGGTPLVKGAGQTGASLDTDGWPNATAVLLAGDFFAFDNGGGGRELKLVKADVASDGSGNATITFEPPIRQAPADNAPLIVSTPTCIMRLVDDQQGVLRFRPDRDGEVTASFVEAF